MKILVIGTGVVGTVYGAHLSAFGHAVSVLAHGARTADIVHSGLRARDAATGAEVSASVTVVDEATADTFDLIVVAVQREHLGAVYQSLRQALGSPCLLFLGNNPDGHATIPAGLPGTTRLGFPGIGGTLTDGVATYLRIDRQPTTIETGTHPGLVAFLDSIECRGFNVTRTPDMDGWLAYHATFVACVAAALYRCGTKATRLAADRPALTLMCRAISEGFSAQRSAGRAGLPRNLALLHHPLLRPIAVRYWASTLRTQVGELCFAAHARRARSEMAALSDDVLAQIGDRPHTDHLRSLLTASRSARDDQTV